MKQKHKYSQNLHIRGTMKYFGIKFRVFLRFNPHFELSISKAVHHNEAHSLQSRHKTHYLLRSPYVHSLLNESHGKIGGIRMTNITLLYRFVLPTIEG